MYLDNGHCPKEIHDYSSSSSTTTTKKYESFILIHLVPKLADHGVIIAFRSTELGLETS
jgi:hypothetical protein